MSHRYRASRLCEYLGLRHADAMAEVQLPISTVYLSERQAELVAVRRLGVHPFLIWPEMVDDRITELTRTCKQCGAPFVRSNGWQVYCSDRCRGRSERDQLQKWRQTSRGRELTRRYAAEHYARHGEKVRDRERARKARLRADPDTRERLRVQSLEHSRRYREKRRAEPPSPPQEGP